MKRTLALIPFAIGVILGLAEQPALHGQVLHTPNTMTAGGNFSSPVATLDDVKWIAGQWQGEAMGGSFEETWTAPQGDSMMGMFRHAVEGKTNFYELLTIVPIEKSLILRLKHFSPELHGWEDKDKTVDFPLVKLTDNEAFFDGLTFRLVGPDELHIFVVIKSNDGSENEMKFAARRVVASITAPESRENPEDGTLNDAEKAIEGVLKLDEAFSRARNEMTRSRSLADSVETYVILLKGIDWTGCPANFQAAMKGHCKAWEEALPFLEQHTELRGEMHDLFDQLRAGDTAVANELEKHFEKIMSTWDDVEAVKRESGTK